MSNPQTKKPTVAHNICVITLAALIVGIMVHRFVYSGFVLARNGMVSKYDLDLWKAYFAWLPGKILCVVNAVLIIAFILECCWMVFKPGVNKAAKLKKTTKS